MRYINLHFTYLLNKYLVLHSRFADRPTWR